MVIVNCFIVGGCVISISIDEGMTVGILKQAIKDAKPNDLKDLDADKLELFLAKTEEGDKWMTREEAKAGVGSGKALAAEMPLLFAGLSDAEARISKEDVAARRIPVHVLVVVPGTIQFAYRAPKRLVTTEGAQWDFQNPLDGTKVADAVRVHYKAWRAGNPDKKKHPLFVCLGAPGTGKSRVLDEFPTLIQERIFEEGIEDPEMMRLLKSAFTFKVTFETETRQQIAFSHPGQAIGTRMLYQLQDAMLWQEFAEDRSRLRGPAQVLSKLSAITGVEQRDMCVILCVDGMQNLSREINTSEFCSALDALSDIVNAAKCWMIAICSATTYSPVNELLAKSSQWIYKVPTASLSRPRVQHVDVGYQSCQSCED